jgi:GT2 family glycosyltransferase
VSSQAAVSVVVAAHNSAGTIADTIASVVLQTVSAWELIVVDDGSRDDTAAVAAAFADGRIRILRQENLGPSAARNTGLRAARAPYVSTLDSDDLWLPHYLETMLRTLHDAPDATLAYTDAWVLDDASGRIRRTTEMAYQDAPNPPPSDPHAFFKELLERNFVYNSVTARRQEVLAAGGYDEHLWFSEDWELWLRIAAGGGRCVRAPGVLAVHRDHPGTLSSDVEQMAASKSRVYGIIERDWSTTDDVRALAQSARATFETPRLHEAAVPDPLLTVLRRLREAVRRRTLWHRRVPDDVAELLAAVRRLVAVETQARA